MSESKILRSFSTAFKVAAVERMEAGCVVTELARQLKVKRKLLYQWQARFKAEGEAGLNRKRGPKPGRRKPKPKPEPSPDPFAQLMQARAKIAELERIIGRQQVDLDFFRTALRVLDADVPQGTKPLSSIPSSQP